MTYEEWSEVPEDGGHGRAHDGGNVPLLPHPDDRLWRHPTEVAAMQRAGSDAGEEINLGGPLRVTEPDWEPKPRHGWLVTVAATVLGIGIACGGYALRVATTRSVPSATRLGATPFSAFPAATTEFVTSSIAGPTVSRYLVMRSLALVRVGGGSVPVVGTAIAYSPGGLFLTASRLVDGHHPITADFLSGGHEVRDAPATVVGIDTTTGIALLKVASATDTRVPVLAGGLPLGTASPPSTGEHLELVGSNADAREAATQSPAVVGFADVNLTTPDGGDVLGASELIVDDSSSILGSAVVGNDGAVMGIVTYCDGCNGAVTGSRTARTQAVIPPVGSGSPAPQDARSPSGSGTMTLMTPIGAAQDAAQQIAESGSASHGWLGVTVQPRVGDNGMPAGVEIESVEQPSPAFNAGLLSGDVIDAVDGVAVTSVPDLEGAISLADPGTPVMVSVERNGSLLAIVVLIGSTEADAAGSE